MAGALTAAIAAAFSGGAVAATDPYYEYTTLLLPGNGTNGAQNNTFLDASTNNFTITRNGNTTQGTFSPFSQTGWGNYFNGSSYLQVASNSNLALGSGDFTVEFWLYSSGASGSDFVIDTRGTGSDAGFAIVFGPPSYILQVYRNGSYILTSSQAFAADVWNHVAFVRNGATSYLYLNGTQVASASDSNTYIQSGAKIGVGWNVNDYLTGYVSNLRIVKGTAVYTSAFTPPTSPLTAITNTTLLTCQSNRFVDNSASPLAITVNGSPAVVAFSPFNPSASWSAATNGGSGYFDGSGDYLTLGGQTALAMGSGDFTIEFWAYLTSTAANPTLFDTRGSGTAGGTNITLYFSPGGILNYYANGSIQISSSAFPTNTWTHVAVSRASGSTRMFFNGVQQGSTYPDSTTYTVGTSRPIIGADGYSTGINAMTGYLSDVRILKGTGYSTITVPTAPLTNITNTSLLLNFTNAGIYDATSKNDLETVGNAQISTAQSKWGGSSMSFNGSSNTYLSIPSYNPDLMAFGSGDFTIEFWLYLNSTSTIGVPYDGRPSGTGTASVPVLYIQSAVIKYLVSGADRITGSTLSTGQWYHIALARSSGSTKLFINGTQSGSTYSDSTVYVNSSGRPLIGGDGNTLGQNLLNGYMQDLRVTKGYARYTANFTAPTAAFPTL